jgi:very-short-patch-repair endonuclease/DNA polymerase III delta prime subunit
VEIVAGIDVEVVKRIQHARRELLDLSARNRLISTPRGASPGRKIEIVDERSEEIFRILVRERKAMSFLAGTGEDDDGENDGTIVAPLAQPDDPAHEDGTLDPRHTDLRLQTRLPSDRLQHRLLDMYFDAQTYEQEQGVSILYLALGFLKWFESPASDKPRYAPLMLIPVELERASAASRFHLRHREEDVTTNLSLQAKLKAEFSIVLPDVPDMEEISPTAYLAAVAQAVKDQPRWEVLRDDMILWFFSFAKYLMYRDLDPANWPAHAPLGGNAMLSSLLGDGFVSEPPLCGEGDKIDPLIPPANMVHVTNADSSQAIVIEEVRLGRHLVVQGPPGTGKSQTITNLIATAVREGKKVLFVAEKMAALDVVHGRLERLGLGALCLELHSHKANKKSVLEELARTLALGRPKLHASAERLEALQAAIARLNRHAEVMNSPEAPSGLTPYEIIGRLSELYGRGVEATNLGLAGLESWTDPDFRDRCRDIEDLRAQLIAIGPPSASPWRGVNRVEPMLHPEFREFLDSLGKAIRSFAAIAEATAGLEATLSLPPREDSTTRDAERLAQFAIRINNAPPLDRTRIADPAWEASALEIARLVEHGRNLAETRYREQFRLLETLRDSLGRLGPPNEHPCRGINRSVPLSESQSGGFPAQLSDTIESLGAVLEVARQLGDGLRIEARPDVSLNDIQQLAQLALRILKAPRLDRGHVTHSVWDTRRDQIGELVKQGQALATTRAELDGKVAEVAWQTDVNAARRHLAGRGTSLFRWFNRDYRNAVVTLKGIHKGKLPNGLNERLHLVDAVISVQATARSLDESSPLAQVGRDAFGVDWNGSKSDWGRLAEIVAWDGECRAAGLAHDHRIVLSRLDQPELCRAPLNILSSRLRPSFDRLKILLEPLELDCNLAFGTDSVLTVPVRVLVDRLRQWQERPEGLSHWIAYQSARRAAERIGLGQIASSIHAGTETAEAALQNLERSFHQDLALDLAGRRSAEASREPLASDQAEAQNTAIEGLWLVAFGSEWKGILSDWTALAAIVKWDRDCREAKLAWDHRYHLSNLDSMAGVRDHLQILIAKLKAVGVRFQSIAKPLDLAVLEAFGSNSLGRIPIRELLSRLSSWRDAPEGLSRWIGYQIRRRRLNAAGLGPLVEALHEGLLPIETAVDQLRVSYFQTLIRDVFRRHAVIAEFDGQTYEQWVEEFRRLDLARIDAARGEVATAHYDAIPRHAAGGEMAVIRREIEKKRRHKPIRQLLKEAGTAILAIKPVFMMSPISVAQFLEPGSASFDLLLIDEASQINPVDAFGAMARARQVVVVGDDKQLPPTRFFSKMLDEGAAADAPEGDLNAGDLESILGLCVAQGMSQRMLRWHYRSRHHSLIAVSNHEFYENHLCVVPSPTTITAMHGLHFRPVQGGVFDRGKTATNRVEARAIADAVIEHARRFPKKSLGVGAFSVSQRDAIRDELEALQREHVELASFFSPGRPEPFFVKNLENIQGDERDVIFISVGYSRDESGYMAMNFGPLSAQGGERRLNVLISRARECCEVFSSITADDIDLQRAKSRGAAAFKTFLQYAATGVLDAQAPTGGDYDSDFERQVALELKRHGYEVDRQVGTAGFVIDLAVVDSNRPGRYLLGIECDGATYHSSRSARDRDRLRETVLRDHGWRIHRVWSTDWFHRQGEQLQRIIAAIEKARYDADADEEVDPAPDDVLSETDIERAEPSEVQNGATDNAWIVPYVEATLEVPSGTPIPETAPSILSGIVASIVEIEGPIHREEVARRVTSLWGQQRIGARISDAISNAFEMALSSEVLRADEEFVIHSNQTVVPIRNRASVASIHLRKPEMIPPSEIRQAILQLATQQIGLGISEVPLLVVKALGFKATGPKLKELIDGVLERMVLENVLTLREQRLYLPG